jgi:hypothetical protein
MLEGITRKETKIDWHENEITDTPHLNLIEQLMEGSGLGVEDPAVVVDCSILFKEIYILNGLQVQSYHHCTIKNGQVTFITVLIVPNHNGGQPMEVNACILITHMVYL